MNLFVYLSLSIYLSVCLSISICLYLFISIYLAVCLSIYGVISDEWEPVTSGPPVAGFQSP